MSRLLGEVAYTTFRSVMGQPPSATGYPNGGRVVDWDQLPEANRLAWHAAATAAVTAATRPSDPPHSPCGQLAGRRFADWCDCGHLVAMHFKRGDRNGCEICRWLEDGR